MDTFQASWAAKKFPPSAMATMFRLELVLTVNSVSLSKMVNASIQIASIPNRENVLNVLQGSKLMRMVSVKREMKLV